MQHIQLIVSTVVLTLLIWVAADQSLTDSAEIHITVVPVIREGTAMLVDLAHPDDGDLTVRVVGPRKRLDDLGRFSDPIPLPIEASETGEHVVNLRRRLAELREPFVGLTIDSVTPSTLRVVVDRYVTQAVPVELEQGSLGLEEVLRVEPATVTVRIRERHWQEIAGRSPKFVIPSIEARLRGRPEGERIEESVFLDSTLLGKPVDPEPNRVLVRGKLLRQLATVSLKAVNVGFFATRPQLWNDYRLDFPDPDIVLTQTITVRGPRDALDRLLRGDPRVEGIIMVTGADTAGGEEFRTVVPTFHLPPEVELVDRPAPVEFRLLSRDRADTGS